MTAAASRRRAPKATEHSPVWATSDQDLGHFRGDRGRQDGQGVRELDVLRWLQAKSSSRRAAGAWMSGTRTGLSKFQFAPRGSEGRPLVERMDGNHEAKIITVGASDAVRDAVIGAVVDKVIEKTSEAVTKYVDRDQTKESIEKYGGCRMKGTC